MQDSFQCDESAVDEGRYNENLVQMHLIAHTSEDSNSAGLSHFTSLGPEIFDNLHRFGINLETRGICSHTYTWYKEDIYYILPKYQEH